MKPNETMWTPTPIEINLADYTPAQINVAIGVVEGDYHDPEDKDEALYREDMSEREARALYAAYMESRRNQ